MLVHEIKKLWRGREIQSGVRGPLAAFEGVGPQFSPPSKCWLACLFHLLLDIYEVLVLFGEIWIHMVTTAEIN
jgi:hypothetical protein